MFYVDKFIERIIEVSEGVSVDREEGRPHEELLPHVLEKCGEA